MDLSKLKGTFRARAVDGGLGETSTGKEEIAIAFEFTGDTELKGQRITYYGYFTEGTLDSTIKGLRACGWQGTEMTDLLDFQKSGLGANEVELVVEPEVVKDRAGQVQTEDDGVTPRTRARVRWVNAVGRMGLREPLAADKAAAFAAKMKAKLVQFDQQQRAGKTNGAPGAAPSAAAPSKPAVDPGQIPF
jgi:hypothetical protein